MQQHILNKIQRGVACGLLPLFAAIVASHIVWRASNGDIVTSFKTAWGDLLFHTRAITFFAEQSGIPHESFLLFGKPVGYAYAADYISSLLLRAHMPLTLSITIPTIVLAALLILCVQWFAFRLTKSLAIAVLSAVLFMGFSGLQGFYTLPELIHSSKPLLETLRTLPHDITFWADQHMTSLNLFTMMLQQRAYLLGFPAFLLLLLTSYRVFIEKNKKLIVLLGALGIALAFLHPHTWLASLLLLPSWVFALWLLRARTFTRDELGKLFFTYMCMGIGGFIMVKLLQPKAGANFLSWHPGWLEPSVKWPLFWIRNIGLHAILAPIAFFVLRKKNKKLAALLLASVVPFVAANLFQFAPWDWDNTKILTPVWLIVCIAVAAALWKYAQKKILYGIAAIMVVLALTLSGGLEILRSFTYGNHPIVLGSSEAYAIGQGVKTYTLSKDVIAHSTSANDPVFIFAGRPSLLTYEGWLWTNGWIGQYEDRSQDLQRLYLGGDSAADVITRYNIAGVVIGPQEKRLSPNVAWFDANLHKVQLSPTTALYLVR